MVPFIIGVVIGACAAIGVLGFLAAVSEDQPEPPRPDPIQWYMEDDGK